MRLAILLLILAVTGGVLILNHDAGTVMGLENDDFARAVVLGMLALLLGAGAIGRYRGAMSGGLKAALFWLVLFLVLVGGYGSKDRIAEFARTTWASLVPGAVVSTGKAGEAVVMRGRDGHFRARVQIEGASVSVMVDTGASSVVLTDRDARAAGIDPARLVFDVTVATANGRTTGAEVMLNSIVVGDIRMQRVKAMVARPGQLDVSLLGNSFLSRLASFTVEGDRMTIRQ